MESDDKKKRHERFLLDRFLERQGMTPTSVDTGESPDFLITLDGRVVGVEVTELFIQRGSPEARLLPEDPTLQAIESIFIKIVSKAHAIYSDPTNPPVLSHIVFSNPIIPGNKKKDDQIAKLIADQIQSMSRQDSEWSEWRSRDDEREENPLSEWVSFISTSRVPEQFAEWSHNRAGTVCPLTRARIQEEIDKKAPKIDEYKKRSQEIWLLIVADRTRTSQRFSVGPDFSWDSICSPFAKTFYYDLVSDEVFEPGARFIAAAS